MDTTHATPTSAPTPAGVATGALLPDALRLGVTRLVVTDHARSVPFYEDVIGLTALGVEGDVASLGTPDGAVVLELEQRPDARRAGRHAGLYHVALLYPSREELARAIMRIASSRTMIEGASDHGTHEAIYLPDPDGNGLELAADRPQDQWPTNLGDIEEIRPRPLDVDALVGLVRDEAPRTRALDGLQVGHLHLHVGDIAEAAAFYVDVVGFEQIMRMDSALFVAAGGYHHHLGLNTWKGVGAPPAPDDVVGLVHWTALVPSVDDLDALTRRLTDAGSDHERIDERTVALRDPWGNELRMVLDPT